MIRRIKTIDAHAAGEPLRLVVDGFPRPKGATMPEKRDWLRRRHDRLRRALMHEPRGHADMYGAVLTDPVVSGSHAGLLFMHNQGYSTMCGHGVIAMVTIALERQLLRLPEHATEITLDTPAGTVHAKATRKEGQVERVSFDNVPSFVLHAGVPIRLGTRELPVDVAFGGAFYAIVDSESVGLPVRSEYLPELRRLAMQIGKAVESAVTVVHPLEPTVRGVYGTIFTGLPNSEAADLRNVAVFADAQVDRSPCGTGTAAVMAVIDAMGLLSPDKLFVHESIIGTQFNGSLIHRTTVGELPAIVSRIAGSAWITGEHECVIHDDDPLRNGFKL